MTKIDLTFLQKIAYTGKRLLAHTRLPINYTRDEFLFRKSQLNWGEIPAQRIAILAKITGCNDTEIKAFIQEGESLYFLPNTDDFIGKPMGETDCLTLYALIRAIAPKNMIETGTGGGLAASYILAAMEKNGQGHLYSIDIAQDPNEIGKIIPPTLKNRFTSFLGDSQMVLPQFSANMPDFDCFLHDSKHHYDHMMFEFEWARQHCRLPAYLVSHDVLKTNAWEHFLQKWGMENAGIVKNLGICQLTS